MKRISPGIILILILAVLSSMIWVFSFFYHRPLGIALSLVTGEPNTVSAEGLQVTPTDLLSTTVKPTEIAEIAEPISTPTTAVKAQTTSKGACSQTGKMFLLFTGADFSMGVYPYGADAIRLIQIDFDQRTVDIVAISRDYVVNVSGLANKSLKETPIGMAYYYKREETAGERPEKILAATNFLAQTLVNNFAVTPQHYLTLQIDQFGDMIDILDGVTVTNDAAFTNEHGVSFASGDIHLNGVLSAEYVRSIEPGGDTARLQRQNAFVMGLRKSILSFKILPKLPSLLNQFQDALVTDLSPVQVQSLACMLETIPEDQIQTYEINGSGVIYGTDSQPIDPQQNPAAFLNGIFGR